MVCTEHSARGCQFFFLRYYRTSFWFYFHLMGTLNFIATIYFGSNNLVKKSILICFCDLDEEETTQLQHMVLVRIHGLNRYKLRSMFILMRIFCGLWYYGHMNKCTRFHLIWLFAMYLVLLFWQINSSDNRLRVKERKRARWAYFSFFIGRILLCV